MVVVKVLLERRIMLELDWSKSKKLSQQVGDICENPEEPGDRNVWSKGE
jgi:hypothetical protein